MELIESDVVNGVRVAADVLAALKDHNTVVVRKRKDARFTGDRYDVYALSDDEQEKINPCHGCPSFECEDCKDYEGQM